MATSLEPEDLGLSKVRGLLMSKSQTLQLGTTLRKLSSSGSALVRIGYEPRRGIVVQVIRHEGGRKVEELAVIGADTEPSAEPLF